MKNKVSHILVGPFRLFSILKKIIKETNTPFNSTTQSIDCADRYDLTNKSITLPCVLFMFIEIKFIYFHSCVMFVIQYMSKCND